MSATILLFGADKTTSAIAAAMQRHWLDGIRPPDFHRVVRSAFPDCTPGQWDAAAASAWAALTVDERAGA